MWVSLAGLALLGGCAFHHDARIATGYISHRLCTAAFVSGLDPEQVYADEILPTEDIADYDPLILREVDREHGIVQASLAGVFGASAQFRGDLGCVSLDSGDAARPELGAVANPAPAAAEPTWGDALLDLPRSAVEPADPRLRAALDAAFDESGDGAPHATRAIVVVHDRHIIAERYAPGYWLGTRMLGYSASKSVTSALIGVLARRHELRVDDRAPVPEWSGADDPRGAITVDDLLRMRTGLQWDESAFGGGVDSAAEMLFLAPDMARYAADLPLAVAPGTHWQYNSGSAMILSRIVRAHAGGSEAAAMRWVRSELFAPLGMRTATFEFDAAGTPMGSSGVLASARDWARFGVLYAQDGVIDGRRILPEGWVEYSARPTPGAEVGYGAGFWTNRDNAGPLASRRISWGMPADAFFAHGYLGQMVVVVPSERLVVVRLGYSHDAGEEIEPVARLVAAAIRAARYSRPEGS